MTERDEQIASFRRLVGPETFDAGYSRLALSPGWVDPIFGLSDLERFAIWIYTTPNDLHRTVNDTLWSGAFNQEITTFSTFLDSALRKLPRFLGTVYRGSTTNLASREFLEKYRPGEIVMWPGFASTTRNRALAYVGNVLFRIESLSGRSLYGYSADDSEEEVLFGTGARYRVADVAIGKDGVIAVDLVEVA